MGQKGEPGAPGTGMGRSIIFGDPSLTAPPSGFAQPGEATHHPIMNTINVDVCLLDCSTL
jgi:hypothetical protein